MTNKLRYILSAQYIVFGLLVIYNYKSPALSSFPAWSRIAFAVLVIAYGAFRLYRTSVPVEETNEEN